MLAAIARAKLNLALHITGIRPDGYHLLSSVVAFANYGDRIEVSPAEALSLHISGEFSQQLPGRVEDNLIWKAAARLRDAMGITGGAAIHLQKNLPVASGIGGGSSDAAAAALLLHDLWQLDLSRDGLAELLLPLGADIPMCLYGAPVLVEGIGEQVTPIYGLPPFGVVLVNPGVAVSTPEVFALYDSLRHCEEAKPTKQSSLADSGLLRFARNDEPDWLELLRQCHNALQEPAGKLAPVIDDVLAELESAPECLLARMSGSGATCFGLFATEEQAIVAAARIRAHYPHWWVQASHIS